MQLLTTRELTQVSTLQDWQIWRFARQGRLRPIRLGNQFIWEPDEVDKAISIAEQIKRRKEARKKQ